MSIPENHEEKSVNLEEETVKDDELEVPDLRLGLILGIKDDGSFYIQQITNLQDLLPLENSFLLKSLLEQALALFDDELQTRMKAGPSARLMQIMRHTGLTAQAIAKLVSDVQTFASLVPQSQQVMSEVLQTLRALTTPSYVEKTSPPEGE